jgi:hypothetical protein
MTRVVSEIDLLLIEADQQAAALLAGIRRRTRGSNGWP